MHPTTTRANVTLLVLMHGLLSTFWVTRRRQARTEERGDVPGWVLITVMTAGLVAGLWAIAGPALEGMLRQALDSVR
jgi:hypothetical protein